MYRAVKQSFLPGSTGVIVSVAAFCETLCGHDDDIVSAVAMNENGRKVVSAFFDNTTRL